MEITEQNLINICGEQPEGVNYIDPGNDPNFVFTSDPAFDVVTLFDVEGNSVFVNSFTECHHYANGGWNYTPTLRNESDYHDFLVVFSIVAIFLANLFFRKFLKIGKR